MPADDATHEARMPEMIEAAVLAVALPCGVDQRQFERQAFGEKALLERNGNFFGKSDADETARGNRVSAMDQAHRLSGADLLRARPVACVHTTSFFAMHHHHRHAGIREHALGNAAKQHAIDHAATVGAHDDEIGPDRRHSVNDCAPHVVALDDA